MKLRYVVLEPDRIYNWLGPENVTAWGNVKQWKDTWWSPETIELRNEFARIWTQEFDNITNHFSLLYESIKNKGILAPVSCVGGPPRDQFLQRVHPEIRHCPPEYQNKLDQIIYTHPFGGSRVTIAQQLGLQVPCVIHDFTNLFPDAPEVKLRNFRQWFKNGYMYTSGTPHIRLSQHSHIKNLEYNGMNASTRKAQREASRITKERMGL